MVPHIVGIIAASIVVYAIKWLLAGLLGPTSEFLLYLIVGGPVYVFAAYKLKKMHGGF